MSVRVEGYTEYVDNLLVVVIPGAIFDHVVTGIASVQVDFTGTNLRGCGSVMPSGGLELPLSTQICMERTEQSLSWLLPPKFASRIHFAINILFETF